jgi:predicted SnoaL-like aldol condensation-catalyzing enzyme
MMLAALAVIAPLSAATSETRQEQKNKQIAINFYNAALNEKNWEKAKSYIGDRYTQHSIYMADGPGSLQKLVAMLKNDFPNNRGEIKRAFADGDIVALHVHVKRTADALGWSVIELLRLKNNKVVEHWDMFQNVPDKSLNNNTMF